MPIIEFNSPVLKGMLGEIEKTRKKYKEKIGKFLFPEITSPSIAPPIAEPKTTEAKVVQPSLKEYLKNKETVWTSDMMERFYPSTSTTSFTPESLDSAFKLPIPPYGTAESKALSEAQKEIFQEQLKMMSGLKRSYETFIDKLSTMLERPSIYSKELKALSKLAPVLQSVFSMPVPMFTVTPPVSAREQQIKELEALTGLALAPATRAKLLREAMEWKPTTMEEALLQTIEAGKAAALPKILGGLAGTLGNIAFMPPHIQSQVLEKLGMTPTTPPIPEKKPERGRVTIDKETFIKEAKKKGYSEAEAEDFYNWNIAPY